MSVLRPMIDAIGLLSSWATPETRIPTVSIFWAWTSSVWSRWRSVRSRMTTR